MVAAGCGGEDEPGSGLQSAFDQLRPPPAGYEYRRPPNPALEQEFRAKLSRDLGADDVVTRSVYKGDKFVAGVVIGRSLQPRSPARIAAKTFPGGAGVAPIEIGGKAASLARARSATAEVAVIDTYDRFMLIVVADKPSTAKAVAAPMVR